jgi:hypothetical protein
MTAAMARKSPKCPPMAILTQIFLMEQGNCLRLIIPFRWENIQRSEPMLEEDETLPARW